MIVVPGRVAPDESAVQERVQRAVVALEVIQCAAGVAILADDEAMMPTWRALTARPLAQDGIELATAVEALSQRTTDDAQRELTPAMRQKVMARVALLDAAVAVESLVSRAPTRDADVRRFAGVALLYVQALAASPRELRERLRVLHERA